MHRDTRYVAGHDRPGPFEVRKKGVYAPRLAHNRDTCRRTDAVGRVGAQALLAEDSPTTYQLNKALRELALAGRALRQLARNLDEQPESLLRGKRGRD